jgi:hypothetical protein
MSQSIVSDLNGRFANFYVREDGMMSKIAVTFLSFVVVGIVSSTLGAKDKAEPEKRVFIEPTPCATNIHDAKTNNCLTCHRDIQPIRCTDSEMFHEISREAAKSGTGSHCVVCHGGDPAIRRGETAVVGSARYKALTEAAHTGSADFFKHGQGPTTFYPDPGSPWINKRTCGQCHQRHVSAQWRSLMMTEAGKIQGTAWGFGGLAGYEHKWGNYAVKNPPAEEHVGEEVYRRYLSELADREPNVFPSEMQAIPHAPAGGKDIAKDPQQAAFTYLRGECQRCHLGVGGKQRYGDYRGMGCSACHMPYSNSGLYQGRDPTIVKDQPGHILVHRIQSTHDSPVTLGEVTYSGIPVETCTTCHNRGRRIGVSFQGLMETAYQGPWQADGSPQQQLHGKNYLKLKPDHHSDKGFVCQDCHTSFDVHSSNHLIGAITAAVEIECFDCHGTPALYPWELPIGFGDEYAETQKTGPPRGVLKTVPPYLADGRRYKAAGDYLKTARGNIIGNAVRKNNTVQVFLASGEVRELIPLKGMVKKRKLSLEGQVAMAQVGKHLERMECYSCHATWAPQCYGCHLKVDYASETQPYDWVALGNGHGSDGQTAEYTDAGEAHRIPGEIIETRSYLRWEDPALAQNGEGRVSPVVPGCQTTVTVIDSAGKPVVKNHIYRVKHAEGKGIPGQLAIDMAPLHPHTVQKEARSCESCHANPKALGYGIAAGSLFANPSTNHVVDLMSGDGTLIPQKTSIQVDGVNALKMDWSRFVTEEGEQLQTVGHHLALSRPLNNEERLHMDRQGTCLACHREIPDQSVAVNLLHHVAEKTGLMPKSAEEHASLLNNILLISGWTQLGAASGFILFCLAIAFYIRHRKRTG